MRTTTSGLLLFLIGAVALTGFLSGRLNDWLAYLFSPAPTTAGATTAAPILGAVMPAAAPSQGGGTGPQPGNTIPKGNG